MKVPRPPTSNTPISEERNTGLSLLTYPWSNWFGKFFVWANSVVRINDTDTTASAGAQTLPANPVGFIVTELEDGTEVKIPYYDP